VYDGEQHGGQRLGLARGKAGKQGLARAAAHPRVALNNILLEPMARRARDKKCRQPGQQGASGEQHN
jgi:hypothetical protein